MSTYTFKVMLGLLVFMIWTWTPMTLAANEMNALTYAYELSPYFGVKGTVAVWQPHVAEQDDMSLSIVGCLAPSVTIYAGYGVSKIFGDDKSRLYLGTTINGKECHNDANCSGFVQVDFTHNLGDILEVSDDEDPSKHRVLEVTLHRNDTDLAWWVIFNSTPMGYIQPHMLPGMLCDVVMWGGVVFTPEKPNLTQMGNGNFPIKGPLKTGEITYASSITDKGHHKEQTKRFNVTSPECYDFHTLGDDHFLYGGPGSRNAACI